MPITRAYPPHIERHREKAALPVNSKKDPRVYQSKAESGRLDGKAVLSAKTSRDIIGILNEA
jgi:hypothetical protein